MASNIQNLSPESSGTRTILKTNGNVNTGRDDNKHLSRNRGYNAKDKPKEKKISNLRYFLISENVPRCLEGNVDGVNKFSKGNKSCKRNLRQKILTPEAKARKRRMANARETTRVHRIVNGFLRLQDQVPNIAEDSVLTRIQTLEMAIAYIKALSNQLSSKLGCDGGPSISMAASNARRMVLKQEAKRKMDTWLDRKLKLCH